MLGVSSSVYCIVVCSLKVTAGPQVRSPQGTGTGMTGIGSDNPTLVPASGIFDKNRVIALVLHFLQ